MKKNKLTAQEQNRIVQLRDNLNEAKDAIAVALAELEPIMDRVNEKIRAYNESLQEARGFAEDIAREQESYWDERSDNWRDSDKGQEFQEWWDAWAGWNPDDIEELEAPTVNVEDHADELDNLPVAAG